MGLPIRKDDVHYTYRDYRAWPEDERWELIDGVAYAMAPPSLNHQALVMALSVRVSAFLSGQPCRVFAGPVGVLLPPFPGADVDTIDTVLEPDLVVVCDPSKLRPWGIVGAPDLVVEILSPSSTRRDLHEKFGAYECSGVREYWVIDPVGRWLQQYVLGAKGTYDPERTYLGTGEVVSEALPGFGLQVEGLWAALILE